MTAAAAATTGLLTMQQKLDVTANNIANTDTTGFKRMILVSTDLPYTDYGAVGAATSSTGTLDPVGIQVGLGTRPQSVTKNLGQGETQITNQTYDLMISGNGYFKVTLPNGDTAYTRDGQFIPNQDGILVNLEGHRVQPEITIPDNVLEVAVNEEGEIYAKVQGEVEPQLIGQLELASFKSPAGLRAIGNNQYLETKASGVPTTGIAGSTGFGSILQGVLEGSNVSPVKEMTDMIKTQRIYELLTKVVRTDEEMGKAESSMKA